LGLHFAAVTFCWRIFVTVILRLLAIKGTPPGAARPDSFELVVGAERNWPVPGSLYPSGKGSPTPILLLDTTGGGRSLNRYPQIARIF
jgi:hypothetical protein